MLDLVYTTTEQLFQTLLLAHRGSSVRSALTTLTDTFETVFDLDIPQPGGSLGQGPGDLPRCLNGRYLLTDGYVNDTRGDVLLRVSFKSLGTSQSEVENRVLFG